MRCTNMLYFEAENKPTTEARFDPERLKGVVQADPK
jgi:hypothetical protein